MAIVSPSQVFTTLADFNGVNGSGAAAALVEGIGGRLYGTSQYGGTSNVGTIFAVSPQGNLGSVLSLSGSDGGYPLAALLLVPNRLLYGTAYEGGPTRAGTVFQTTPTGTLTTLHSFSSTGGGLPISGLAPAFNGITAQRTKAGPSFSTAPSSKLRLAEP